MTKWFSINPKRLLIVDAAGATVSALLMGCVVPSLVDWLGIPANMSSTLAIIPIFYVVYDLICYQKSNVSLSLKGLALLNLLYIVISIGHAVIYHDAILTLGWIYLASEFVILIALIWLEWEVSERS